MVQVYLDLGKLFSYNAFRNVESMRSNTKTIQQYKDRRAKGLCGLCGAPTDGETSKCSKCRESNNQRHIVYRQDALKAYGARCVDCGETQEDQLLLRQKVQTSLKLSVGWVRSNKYPNSIELWCKKCRKIASEKRKIDYLKNNYEYLREKERTWRANNPDKVHVQRQLRANRERTLSARKYIKRKALREQKELLRQQKKNQRLAYFAERRATEPERRNQRLRNRRKTNPGQFRGYRLKSRTPLRGRLDTRVRRLLKRVLEQAGQSKTQRTHRLLGYTTAEFKLAIEQQFRDNMTWDNVGIVWELDHICEVATFLDEGVTDPAIINALSNLQPLLVAEHRAKTTAFLAKRAL